MGLGLSWMQVVKDPEGIALHGSAPEELKNWSVMPMMRRYMTPGNTTSFPLSQRWMYIGACGFPAPL